MMRIEDVEYQRQGGKSMLARIYRPSGTGPFPAALQVHGGAWVHKDRIDNDFMAKALAESGILVASIDFRMPPDGGYPASLQDINLGIRWLKARARLYGSRPGDRQLRRRAAGIRYCSRRAPRRPALLCIPLRGAGDDARQVG